MIDHFFLIENLVKPKIEGLQKKKCFELLDSNCRSR